VLLAVTTHARVVGSQRRPKAISGNERYANAARSKEQYPAVYNIKVGTPI
jgi:hypothetical protein